MSSMKCSCGEKISFGLIPNPNEWLFISDVEYDGFCGEVDSDVLYRKMNHFIKCPQCDSMWFFWDGFDSDPVEYKRK